MGFEQRSNVIEHIHAALLRGALDRSSGSSGRMG
jgi:hypothetical protein